MTKLDYEILLVLRLYDACWTFSELQAHFTQRRGILQLKLRSLMSRGLIFMSHGRYSISIEGVTMLDEIIRCPYLGVTARKWVTDIRAGFRPGSREQTKIKTAAIPQSLSEAMSYNPPMEEILDLWREIDA